MIPIPIEYAKLAEVSTRLIKNQQDLEMSRFTNSTAKANIRKCHHEIATLLKKINDLPNKMFL